MTLPGVARQALQLRHSDPSLRVVYPASQLRVELANDFKTRILTLETPDESACPNSARPIRQLTRSEAACRPRAARTSIKRKEEQNGQGSLRSLRRPPSTVFRNPTVGLHAVSAFARLADIGGPRLPMPMPCDQISRSHTVKEAFFPKRMNGLRRRNDLYQLIEVPFTLGFLGES